MAKKKSRRSSFNMSAAVRDVLKQNPKLSAKEVEAEVKKQHPRQKINSNSLSVSFSSARKKLGITKTGMPKFRVAIDAMMSSGRIREGKKGRLQMKAAVGFVTGVVKKIASGAAFVMTNEKQEDGTKQDIYVSERDIRDAQTGDEVLVRLLSRTRSSGQRCGQVEKVLERSSNVFVGTYLEAQGTGFVRVDGSAFSSDIHVGDPGAKGAKPDDKVVIEMLRFPAANRRGAGHGRSS